MLAILKTGGKQYIVKEGQTLEIEKILVDAGAKVEFDAMLVADEAGASVKVGTPTLAGAKVMCTVVEHGKGDKVSVVKYKRKVRYRRNVGHRQPYTKIKIDKIVA